MRAAGFSAPNPIPLTEIVAWMDLHCLDGAELRSECYTFVAIADATALEWYAEKNPPPKDTPPKEPRGRTPPPRRGRR